MFVHFQYTDVCLMIIEIRHAFFHLFPKDYWSTINLAKRKTRLQINQTTAPEPLGRWTTDFAVALALPCSLPIQVHVTYAG